MTTPEVLSLCVTCGHPASLHGAVAPHACCATAAVDPDLDGDCSCEAFVDPEDE